MFSMEDWEKMTIEEVKMRQGNRRREIEKMERKKIEIRKKKKEEKRKRVIRERRCFVCGIFGHMAYYCRNREEEKRSTQMPLNRFQVLRQSYIEKGGKWKKSKKKSKRNIERRERKEGKKDEDKDSKEGLREEKRKKGR